MAGMNYLESGPENRYAIQNLGETFSNAVLGMQRNRMALQNQAAQQAIEQAYLRMAQEKQQAQMPYFRAQADAYQADALRQRALAEQAKQSQMAGQDLGFNMQQYYDAQPNAAMHPELIQAIQGQIARQQGTLAATHPATIGKQVPQIMESVDPTMRQMIATGQHPFMPVAQGASIYDTINQRFNQAPDSPERIRHDQAMEQKQGKQPTDEDKKMRQAIAVSVLHAGAQGIRNMPASKQGEAMNTLIQKALSIAKGESSMSSSSPMPKTFKDGSGRTWNYKGSNPNPKADSDPSMWEEVK